MSAIPRSLSSAALALLALLLGAAPSLAQSGWKPAPMDYQNIGVDREDQRYSSWSESVVKSLSLPPLHLADLPEGAEEIRIWVDFGIFRPHRYLRLTTVDGRSDGELVYWWISREHPAEDSLKASIFNDILEFTGSNGCNESVSDYKWRERLRDGTLVEHDQWIFACKIDLEDEDGRLWDLIRERLVELEAFDLPDPSTLEPTGFVVLDGMGISVEILKGSEYHSYSYSNPRTQPWPEARLAEQIMYFTLGIPGGSARPQR